MSRPDPPARDRRRLERARHGERRRPGPAPLARAVGRAHASWTRCTTRRTRSSTSAASAATSWPARPTSSTARTSACCTAGASGSRRSTSPKLAPAPDDGAGAARDRHAESRGHRRRRRGGRVPRVARADERRPRGTRLRAQPGRAAPAGAGAARAAVDGTGADRGVRLYGPPPGRPRTPTVALHRAASRTPDDGRRRRWRRKACSSPTGISTRPRWSSGWASRAHGLVRAGCACYTTTDEVDRLVAGVRDARPLTRRAGQAGLDRNLHPGLLPLEHERGAAARRPRSGW